MKIIVLVLSFLFIGCGNLPQIGLPSTPGQGAAAGAVTGAAAVKVTEKIVEVFTPKFPLYLQPIELCTLAKEVTCFLVPCTENCMIQMTFAEFIEVNPKVATLRTSAKQVNAMQVFCKNNKNEKACVKQIANYEGANDCC